ncbi:NAD(P)/FAD-dependent oxidoreductase [Marinobacterium aestuariivivens]|uniref:NAD(P)/FAD-dependent oxidoreductase n=1 Tax=Marinobacterium aestuariivivens TaxID=1698799 RepID=A0ABW2A433_9GAMM
MINRRIAIVGAGLAGSVLAERLAGQGHLVTVFEKSRGSGGRMASARIEAAVCDLGVPWLEARGEDFHDWLLTLVFEGVLEPWNPCLRDFDGAPCEQRNLFVARESSSALTRRLLHGAGLDTGVRVGRIDSIGDGVELFDDSAQALGRFDWAFVATPAPQAEPLLATVPALRRAAQRIETRPAWVVAAQCGVSDTAADVYSGGHGCFEQVVNEGAKPGRQPGLWRVQMTADWSRRHLDAEPGWVVEQARNGLETLLGTPLDVGESRAHRWLYSRNTHADLGCGLDPAARVGACGDWLQGGDAEGAWHSAMALADAVENVS